MLGRQLSVDFLMGNETGLAGEVGEGESTAGDGHMSPGAAADPTECRLCWIIKRLSLWVKISKGLARSEPCGNWNRIRAA